MHRLSIILPTYNGAPFLRAQLDSILTQTMGDFELLCVDDGSSDATPAILAAAARADPRITVFSATGNRGQVSRLAELMAAARAPLLCVADQDDLWHPDKNRLLVEAIEDRAMAFGRSDLIDADGVRLGSTLLDAIGVTPDPAMRLRALFRPLVSGHAMIVRRDWLNPAAFAGAVPFDMALAHEALFSDGLAYCAEAVVMHRLHGGNQMNGEVNRDRAGGALSRARAVRSLSGAEPARLQLWLSLDQLGRSPVLAPALRATMRRLATDCYGAWFSPWRNAGRADRGADLRAALATALDSLAGCEADRADFRHRLDEVTRPAWHIARWSRIRDRYTGKAE